MNKETLLRRYMYNQSIHYQNELTQLRNNVAYRNADYLDHLEFIITLSRIESAQKIFNDIHKILNLADE